MDKLLICLDVPSIGRTFELYAPTFLPVRELIPLLVRAVKEMSGNQYVSSGHEFLCEKAHDYLLDEDAALQGYDIGYGDHLVLM